MPHLFDRFPALDPACLNASELAAIVHEEGAAVDHLTAFFADELKAAGRRVGGVIHLPDDDEPPAGRATVIDLIGGDRWTEPRVVVGPRPISVHRIRSAVEARADLVIIPRFGAAEIAGGGHVDAFGTVAAFGIPILTVVQRSDIDAWLRFTGGIGTLLACRLRVVRAWWEETDHRRQRSLARAAAARTDDVPDSAKVIPLLPSFD